MSHWFAASVQTDWKNQPALMLARPVQEQVLLQSINPPTPVQV